MHHFPEAGIALARCAVRYRSSPIASDVLRLEPTIFRPPNVEGHTGLWTNVRTLARSHDQSIPVEKYFCGVVPLEETVAQPRVVPGSSKRHLEYTKESHEEERGIAFEGGISEITILQSPSPEWSAYST